MATERVSVNVRLMAREREAIDALVAAKVYPTISAFMQRAVEHLIDHESGMILEGGAALRREIADYLSSDEGQRLIRTGVSMTSGAVAESP